MTVQVTTIACPHCGGSVMPGVRWCGLCKGNVVNPEAGKLASPGFRLAAFVIDLIVPIVVLSMAGIGTLLSVIGLGSGHTGSGGFMTLLLMVGFVAYMVWVFKLFVNGQTPGKLTMKIRVVKQDGSAPGFWFMLARECVGKWISGFIFGLGWFFILFDKENQGWHDKLVSTYVVTGS